MFLHLKGKRNSEQLNGKETGNDREKERERESNIETEPFSEENKKSMTSSNNGKYKIQSWKPQRMQETFQKTWIQAHGVDL